MRKIHSRLFLATLASLIIILSSCKMESNSEFIPISPDSLENASSEAVVWSSSESSSSENSSPEISIYPPEEKKDTPKLLPLIRKYQSALLERSGIDFEIDNVVIEEKYDLFFELILKKGSATRTFPQNASAYYNGSKSPNKTLWGTIAEINDSTLAILNSTEIHFIDVNTLEDVSDFSLEAHPVGVPLYYSGIVYNPSIGYMVSATDMKTDEIYLLFYHDDGSFNKSQIMKNNPYCSLNSFFTPEDWLLEKGEKPNVRFIDNIMFVNLDNPILIFPDSYDVKFYDLTQDYLYAFESYGNIENDNDLRSVSVYGSSIWGGSSNANSEDKSGVAILYDDGIQINHTFFNISNVPITFALTPKYFHIDNDALVAKIPLAYDPYNPNQIIDDSAAYSAAYSMRIDFNVKTMEEHYSLDPKDFDSIDDYSIEAVSPKGRYQILPFMSDGGGDGYWGYYILYDTYNETANYLCRYGTLPFAAQEIQFLDDSTIAINYGDAFKLYDIQQQCFTSFNLDLPLGTHIENTAGDYNVLISFCKDSNTGDYGALYLTKNIKDNWQQSSYNYKAILFDNNGGIKKTIDTEEESLRKIYYTYHPVIKLSNSILNIYSIYSSEEILFSVSFA